MAAIPGGGMPGGGIPGGGIPGIPAGGMPGGTPAAGGKDWGGACGRASGTHTIREWKSPKNPRGSLAGGGNSATSQR